MGPMMDFARWTLGVLMMSICIWVVFANWASLLMSIVSHRFHSQIPLVGPLFRVLGLTVVPVSIPWYYILLVLADCGTVVFLIWSVGAICKKYSGKSCCKGSNTDE